MVWFLPSGLVCCQFMVVNLLLFTYCGCVFIMWYIVLWCGSCPVALSAVSLWWSLCCCLLILGVCLLCGTLSCLLSVNGGHSVVVYSLWVCVYYVVHCLVVWFLPSGLVCCQFMVVTLLLFTYCGCVFIMWYIVLWCGSCPVALSAVSLWCSLCCCCSLILDVCLLCGTLSCLLSVYGGHSVVVYSL